MLNPVAMSIIRNVFEDPRERAQAIGVWGGVIGISMALGPVVGGALTDSVGWPAVFLVNVPIGVAAIVLTALYVPESRAENARRIDPLGAGAGDRRIRDADLRDHRGSPQRLAVGADADPVRRSRSSPWSRWSATSCTATSR